MDAYAIKIHGNMPHFSYLYNIYFKTRKSVYNQLSLATLFSCQLQIHKVPYTCASRINCDNNWNAQRAICEPFALIYRELVFWPTQLEPSVNWLVRVRVCVGLRVARKCVHNINKPCCEWFVVCSAYTCICGLRVYLFWI